MKGKGIIGIKVGMTRIFGDDGTAIPVTVVLAGPCVVLEKKTEDKHGYNAIKVGFDEVPLEKLNKPERGIFEKLGLDKGYRKIVEFRVNDPKDLEQFEVGKAYDVSLLDGVEKVNVIGYTKGRGFSGAIKRHGFRRGPVSHGSKNIRDVGSIGMSTFPAKVIKGKRMPGRYGNERVTVRNLEVVKVMPEDNLVLLKGSVPGANGNYIYITF